jgi:glycosyltransferase involved in cell wall biosynthesis
LFFFVTEDWYFVSHRLSLAVAAKNAGYDVGIATRVRKHGDIIRAAGLKLIPFENSRSGFNPWNELSTLVRLILLWRRERPHIVHHVATKPILYGTIAARIARVPLIVNAFGGMGWLFTPVTGLRSCFKPLVRLVLGRLLRSGIALVQNPDDERFLIKLGISASSIRRIPGAGVDLREFRAQPEPSGTPVVVLPARLLWAKGVGEFVAAARLIEQRGTKARFVLAGEPDESSPTSVPRDQIATWVADGAIEHLGWVTNMSKLLAESHIVCLPSFYGEGIPKSLIEAAAAGRPIVTTDTPGCREIVHHGDNGLLVPVRNVNALAQALETLIKDSNMRRQMGARGRIRAEGDFGLQSVVRQTLALYEEAPC